MFGAHLSSFPVSMLFLLSDLVKSRVGLPLYLDPLHPPALTRLPRPPEPELVDLPSELRPPQPHSGTALDSTSSLGVSVGNPLHPRCHHHEACFGLGLS